MKTKRIFFSVALLFSMALGAKALVPPAGDKEIIPTKCVVKGETVGYANDCGSGSGNCRDNVCS